MEILLVPVFVVTFAGIWLGVVWLTSVISGWHALAQEFRAESEFAGRKWTWQSGELRGMGFRNVLTVGADPRGLSLAVMALFRVGHPPLFVPWNRIVVAPKRRWFRDGVEFRLGGQDGVALWLRAELAAKLEQEANRPGWASNR